MWTGRRRSRSMAALSIAVVLGVAGCGDDDSDPVDDAPVDNIETETEIPDIETETEIPGVDAPEVEVDD